MKRSFRYLLLVFIGGLPLIGLSSPAVGQSPAAEKNLHERLLENTSESELRSKASSPDVYPWETALYSRLRWSRALGEGNSLEARRWCESYVASLKSAAEDGDVRGMVELGKIFTMGTDVFPADKKQAKEWFAKAAKAGSADSLYHLGFLAEHEEKPDRESANKWYAQAFKAFLTKAEQGDAHAAFWVGMMYRKGQGVEKSSTQAYPWLMKAAEAGNLQAQVLVAFMAREGDGCEASDSIAVQWFEKAAGNGDAGAMIEVALAYLDGKGVEKDEAQARKWVEKAARMTDPFALQLLGDMMLDGQGGAKDETQALAYYQQAASLGEGWSAMKAYRMLKDGKGSPPDEKAAMEILKRAANEYNFPYAVFELGVYERESGDRKRGNALVEKSARQGVVRAMNMLGKWQLFPVFEPGISWNPLAGCRWLNIAAERGDDNARTWLYSFIAGSVLIIASLIGVFLWKMNKIIKRRQALMDEEEANNGNSRLT